MIDLQSIGLSGWMVDTFIYTGLLIGLVLLVRRPITRYFGPRFAYALWALPLLRLVMPPIVLPAWMAPEDPAAPEAAASGTEPLMIISYDASASLGDAAAATSAAPTALTVTDLLIPLWLAGAAVFLGWRVREYWRMRRDLLAEARPVGEAGKVRLVETSAVSAPVAFGVRDKVVALPVHFMALLDVQARDMAIAHELEHHRGHDLLANIAAQPLLALHWFNPLAWWGWRAMRRDQEAACDARVVAGRARSERAAYAEVIAGFAAGEHLALAAPMASSMACPILGEKSIIHRLRSLSLTDISTRRRRIGIAAITTTALALPLTASITYAQPPAEPLPQQEAQDADTPEIEAVDPDVNVRVIRVDRSGDGEEGAEYDYDVEELEDGQRIIIRTTEGEDGERRTIRRVIRTSQSAGDTELRAEELQAIMVEVERELEGLDEEIESQIELALSHRDRAGEMGGVFVIEEGQEGRHNIEARCDGDETISHVELSDGRRAMVVCNAAVQMHAANGLRGAIEAIAANRQISAEMREQITNELEEAISEMERTRAEMERVSMRFTPPTPPKPSRVDVRTNRVTFGFTANGPASQSVRITPIVHPLTGQPAPAAHDDCDETATDSRA